MELSTAGKQGWLRPDKVRYAHVGHRSLPVRGAAGMESPIDHETLTFTPLNVVPIEVNVDGLNDFRAFLARELDTNLRPAAEGISNDHGMGVHFGVGNEGARIQAARTRYAEALQASYENLAQYIAISEILIEAIRTVTATYSEADLSAASRSKAITDTLVNAVSGGIKLHQQAIADEVEHETQRETRRGT